MTTTTLLPPEIARPDVIDAPGVRRKPTPARRSSRSELGRALLVVTAVFIVLEIFTRTFLFRASKDFSQFLAFPHRSAVLVDQPGTRIAFVGNSLTREGIDPQIFSQTLSEHVDGVVAADVFAADASKINVWYYLMNRYFWRPERSPDLFIVSYYENNLLDGNSIEIGRFAQFFVERQDWPEVFSHDVTSFGQRMEFLLSSGWATFAARDRIKERVLSLLVPHYQELTLQTNEIQRQQRSSSLGTTTHKAVTHDMLKRFLARANEHRSKIVFVAFPTIIPGRDRPYQPYELDSETTRLIREAGMQFVDLRQVPELTPDMYADDIHLNAIGRPIFSHHLATALSAIVKQDSAMTQQPTSTQHLGSVP